MRSAIARASGPERRTMPRPPRPGGSGDGGDRVVKIQAGDSRLDLRTPRSVSVAAAARPPSRPRGHRLSRHPGRRRRAGCASAEAAAGLPCPPDRPPPCDARRCPRSRCAVRSRSRRARWITRRSRLFMGLNWNGDPVRLTFSAAADRAQPQFLDPQQPVIVRVEGNAANDLPTACAALPW